MANRNESPDSLSSTQAAKRLRVDSCELMHLRLAGKLSFEKRGNAFYYETRDVDRVAAEIRRRKSAAN